MSESLKDRALGQLKVGIAVKLTGQLLVWVTTLVTIRLLDPEDYGLLALSFVLISYSAFLTELGLGASIVQAKELNRDILRPIFGWILTANTCLFVLFVLCAPMLAAFFDADQIVPLIRALSVVLIGNALNVLPAAMLIRDLRIRDVELINLCANVSSGLCTLSLAYLGYGVWALVIGQLVLSGIKVTAYWSIRPVPVAPSLKIRAALDNLKFGGWRAAATACWEYVDRIDYFILGKLMSKGDIGIYSVAIRFASLPLDKVGALIQSVGLSSYAKVQENQAAVASSVLRTSEAAAIAAFPLFVGLCMISPEVVQIIFGDKWLAAIVPMQLICLAQPFRLLHNVSVPAIDGTGRPKINALIGTAAALAFSVGFYIGALRSIEAVALAWVLVIVPWFFVVQTVRMRVLGVAPAAYFAAILLPAVCAAGMGLGLYLLEPFLAGETAAVRLGVKVASGGLLFALLSVVLMRTRLSRVLGWFRPTAAAR